MSREVHVKTQTRVRWDAAQRLKDAVAGSQARGSNISLEEATTLGLELAAQALESEHNEGERFPPRDGDLRKGRRPGSISLLNLEGDSDTTA